MDDHLSPQFKMKFQGLDKFYSDDQLVNETITPSRRYHKKELMVQEKVIDIFHVDRPNTELLQKQQLKLQIPIQVKQTNRFKSLIQGSQDRKPQLNNSIDNNLRQMSKQTIKANQSGVRVPLIGKNTKSLLPKYPSKLPEMKIIHKISPQDIEQNDQCMEKSISNKLLDNSQILYKQSPARYKLVTLPQTKKQCQSEQNHKYVAQENDDIQVESKQESVLMEIKQDFTIMEQQAPQPTKPKLKENNLLQKVEHLIKNKSYESHAALMQDYLKRINRPDQSKVFSFNSQDEHIRRFLLRHKWIENQQQGTQVYDMKWSYTDSVDEVNNLIDGQYYNHFRNSRELTSKNGLLINFKNNCEYGLDPFQFFPRSYDLGNASERDDFIVEYERTAYFIILKKHVKYLKKRRPKLVQTLRKEIINETQQKKIKNLEQSKRLILSKELHRKFKTLYKPEQLQNDTEEKDLVMNLHLICDVVSKLSDWKHQLHGFIEEVEQEKEISTRQQQILKECLSQYSKCDPNYDKLEVKEKKKTLLLANQNYQTPNRMIMKKIIKYHYFFKAQESSYKNDGIENVWIVKPSGNARGQGIYLEKNIDEAIDQGKGMQARIIQKYLEKPLIFTTQDKQYKAITGKKFDIRQWVLVRSFQPLRIYMFSQCYMRMCSQPYDLKDYKNPYKHLTNYSLNKNNFDSNNESVFSSQVLADLLNKGHGASWEQTIQPKIKDLIIDTLRSLQEQFEGEPKNSFELFGFDIILDKQLKPWLLEVNLSPACAERVSWLTEMLNYMTEGMFRIVLPANYYQASEFLPEMNKYYWEPLLLEENLQALTKMQQEVNFQIQGTKINPKREKKAEIQHNRLLATLVIQKFSRMFLAKNELLLLRHTKCAIIFQRYGRMYLAKREKQRLKDKKCVIMIQCRMRCFMACKRILLLKQTKCAIMIQKLSRGHHAKNVRDYLIKEKAALYIQQLIKVQRALKIYEERRTYFKSTVFIQVWWRYNFHLLTKLIKGQQSRKQYQLLLKRIQFAIKIQANVRTMLAKQFRSFLKRERAALYLQTVIKAKLKQNQFKRLKQQDGFSIVIRVYNNFRRAQSLKNIQDHGDMRNQAAERIQGIRLIRLAIRYLKRLKKLKLVVKLQRMIKMYIQRKRYLRTIKRHRMIKKIVRAIKCYQFKKRLQILINRKKYALQPQKSQKNDSAKTQMTQISLGNSISYKTIQQPKISSSKIKDRNSSQQKKVIKHPYQKIQINQQEQQLLQKMLNEDLNQYYNQDSQKTFKKPTKPTSRR